jgi:septal ring factor EnvC (AmiA/AmiB activator)
MEKYLKVEGDQFVKDKSTNAILAVNRNILLQNEARKKLGSKLKDSGDEINNLKLKVEQINTDIFEIKDMLKMLIQKKDNN